MDQQHKKMPKENWNTFLIKIILSIQLFSCCTTYAMQSNCERAHRPGIESKINTYSKYFVDTILVYQITTIIMSFYTTFYKILGIISVTESYYLDQILGLIKNISSYNCGINKIFQYFNVYGATYNIILDIKLNINKKIIIFLCVMQWVLLASTNTASVLEHNDNPNLFSDTVTKYILGISLYVIIRFMPFVIKIPLISIIYLLNTINLICRTLLIEYINTNNPVIHSMAIINYCAYSNVKMYFFTILST